MPVNDKSGTQFVTPEISEFLPLSKTIIKDCTLLELQSGETKLQEFLSKQSNLSDDVKACYNVLKQRKWKTAYVENFRSLNIGLLVLEVTKGMKFEIIKGSELARRELDLQSSQWNSAKVCCGLDVEDNRYHVEIARNVVKRYNAGERESLFNSKDEVYIDLMNYVLNGKSWVVNNPEIAVFFAIFHPERLTQMIKDFPTWKHHETDRSKSILKALEQFQTKQLVTSNDHRIVIGIALLAYLLNQNVLFLNYMATWKSFPKFFDMLELIKHGRQ